MPTDLCILGILQARICLLIFMFVTCVCAIAMWFLFAEATSTERQLRLKQKKKIPLHRQSSINITNKSAMRLQILESTLTFIIAPLFHYIIKLQAIISRPFWKKEFLK